MKWNTEKMIKLLSNLPVSCKIQKTRQGGDVDSTNLMLTANGARDVHLFVVGFVESGKPGIVTPDDCEIDMIEVSDGEDSRGGLNTSDPATCRLYAEVVSALRRCGFCVVNCLKDYF